MNAFLATICFGLTLLATAYGQGQCGCAPQPTIIQVSCNGQGNHGVAPQYPPAGPPAPPPAGPPAGGDYYETSEPPSPDHTDYHESYGNTDIYGNPESQDHSEGPAMDDYPVTCDVDAAGNPTSSPPGGWPAGYNRREVECGEMACLPAISVSDDSQQRPPGNWDGYWSTLGFTPRPGTATYNMVQCWPVMRHLCTEMKYVVNAQNIPDNTKN